mgnify:CR=1 FL=1
MQSIDLLLSFGTGHGGELLRIATIAALAGMGLHLSQRFIPRLRDYIAAQQDNQEGSRRILTLSRVIRYSVNVIIVTVAALSTLSELGISVAPILGAAGVIGIAIGFGAQSLVKDYFTGFFLLLENQIRHGDVVEAGGKSGLVEELTLRYLRLRDYDGNVHFVPNGTITAVTNMSYGFAQSVMDIGVAYGEQIDEVVGVMRTVATELSRDPAFQKKILDELEIAGVESWADSAIVIRCRFRVAPLEQWSVRREYLKRLKQAFDLHGIEIPYPHVKLVLPPSTAGNRPNTGTPTKIDALGLPR